MDIEIRFAPSSDWDQFVEEMPSAPVYLQSRWPLAARDAFGHEAYFVEARASAGNLVGVLPLMQQKSWLLGNFLTSLPFFNYGGALATSESVAKELMICAGKLGQETGCQYVEFRDLKPRAGEWFCRTDKVTMIRPLPDSESTLAKELGSKLRAQIRRADREDVEVRHGGAELVDEFYSVFAANMRDLGTPVYPKQFFETVVDRASDTCRLIVLTRRGKAAAAAVLITYRQTTEIPWAACIGDAKRVGCNMRLYWEALCAAIGMGSSRFDFGRTTVDSGTYRFKKQWGAQPSALYWHRCENRRPKRGGAEVRVKSTQERMMSVWQRLPLSIANRVGPIVSPYLPW